jgi:type III secretory pathway component EscR
MTVDETYITQKVPANLTLPSLALVLGFNLRDNDA